MRTRATAGWLPVAFAVAVVIKVVLCANMPLDVHANAAYDDAWAVRVADFLTQGQWLGPYDDVTLIKNIGFPVWLALCHMTGVGYLLGTALLYALASLAFALAVRPLVKRDWMFFALFALILFCPVSFATDTFQRVYRNSITAAQALLVFAAYLGCCTRVKCCDEAGGVQARTFVPWVLVGAVGLPWFWLSREDSIWIAPFALVATVALVAMLVRGAARGTGQMRPAARALCAVLLCVPVLATALSVQAVKSVNEAHYGVAVTAEISTGNFARMVKDLYAIDPARTQGADGTIGGIPQNQRVAVTHAALLSAYAASPTLASVKGQEEAQFAWGDTIDNNPADGEVNGGEFFWTLRRAARDAGVYAQGAKAADTFYGQVADELESAFASGTLPQRAIMPSSVMTPWRAEYAGQLMPAASGIFAEALSYGDVTAQPFAAQGTDDGIAYFERITGNKAYREAEPVPVACCIGEAIVWLYRVIGVVFGVAGVVSAIGVCAVYVRKKVAKDDTGGSGALVLVLIALFLGTFVLVAGLAYSRVSSFVPIAYYYYGSAAYPLLLAFCTLATSHMAHHLLKGDLSKGQGL